MSSLCKSTDFLSVHSSSSSVAAGALASSRDWFTMTSGLVVGTCWAGRVAVDIGRVIDKPLWAAGWAVAGAWGAGVMAVGWVTYKPFSTASCKSLPPPPLDYDYDGNEEEGKKDDDNYDNGNNNGNANCGDGGGAVVVVVVKRSWHLLAFGGVKVNVSSKELLLVLCVIIKNGYDDVYSISMYLSK